MRVVFDSSRPRRRPAVASLAGGAAAPAPSLSRMPCQFGKRASLPLPMHTLLPFTKFDPCTKFTAYPFATHAVSSPARLVFRIPEFLQIPSVCSARPQRLDGLSIFAAHVVSKEDEIVNGVLMSNTDRVEEVRFGLSFNIDKALEWLKE